MVNSKKVTEYTITIFSKQDESFKEKCYVNELQLIIFSLFTLHKTFARPMYVFKKNFFDGIIIVRVLFNTCDKLLSDCNERFACRFLVWQNKHFKPRYIKTEIFSYPSKNQP